MSLLVRIGITAGVVIGAAVLVAIVVAVVDLYLTGHSLGSLTRESITAPAWGVHMSIADLVLLVVAALAGAVTWWLLPRRAE